MSSEPLISVSGVRGIVSESFTEDLVRNWASAFAKRIGSRQQAAGSRTIVLGRDTRPSGDWALRIAAEVFEQQQVQPIVVGIVPTPTAQLAVTHHHAAGGLIITGSHNPAEWNALKFLGPDGVFLSAEEMQDLEEGAEDWKPEEIRSPWATLREDTRAIGRHIENVLSLPINVEQIRARNFRIVVDPVNGAGALAAPQLLEALGCNITIMNGEPTGDFAHPPEPTPANLQGLGAAVREHRADLGVAVDPDADRLVLVNEHGVVLSEEYTVTLAALSVLEHQQMAYPPIVVNLSTTRMVDDMARHCDTTVVRTPVGERHVVEGMRQHKALIGGEGNGGVIFPQSHEGRDSLVGIALILDLLARRHTSLAQLVQTLPRYVMTKEKLPRSGRFETERLSAALQRAFPGAPVTTLDGIRVDTADGWVHLRPSNTEPIVRLIAEGVSEQVVLRFVTAVRSLLAVPA